MLSTPTDTNINTDTSSDGNVMMVGHDATANPHGHVAAAAMVLVVTIALVGVAYTSPWQGARDLHTIMEVVATCIAAMVGVLALLRFYARKNNTILFLGAGFLGAAALDGYHAIVTSRFFAESFPSPMVSLAPWSWNASRIYLGSLLTLSWLMWRTEQARGRHVHEILVYALTAMLTLTIFAFFAFVPLPRAYYSDFFFGRPEEFAGAFLFFIAICGYVHKGTWQTESIERWLIFSLALGFVSQAVVMSRSHQLYDSYFDVAHVMKIASYGCVLTGLLIGVSRLMKDLANENKVRKQVESQLRRNQHELQERNLDLARSNDELQQFAYVASHDLQEPLRKVSAFCELLESDYGDKFDSQGREYMTYIVGGAGRMRKLIQDLLEYSRVESQGRGFEEVDSGEALRQSLLSLDGSIESNQVAITFDDDFPTVRADPQQLAQLFLNLVGNAIKYHGPLTPKVHIGFQAATNEWRFFVSDNGIGIDPRFHERIFGVFKRLHTREAYSGTGIGLAICKRIVDRLKGRIWVESSEGEGCIFHFTIPR